MKHKDAVALIESRFSKIILNLQPLIVNFEMEDIHRFRVEIKKLKSFLHAIETGLGHNNEVRLPKQVRKFYAIIGLIRNLQLQQVRIDQAIKSTNDGPPIKYISILDKEMKAHINEARNMMQGKDYFNEAKKDIEKILRKNPDKTKLKHFFYSEADLLQKQLLLMHTGDEALHTIRKILKDILYAQSYTSEETKSKLPSWMSAAPDVKLLTELLGNFQDARTSLMFFGPSYVDQLPESERILLMNIEKEWQDEKENIKQQACERLKKYKFISAPLKQYNRKAILH